MVERKIVDWLMFKVRIELRDDIREGYTEHALAGVDDDADDKGIWTIWFKGLPAKDAFVHECWHLFFTIMMYCDQHSHFFCRNE